jgi:8-oxo-dGTP pyrophosphatase MutT (NUDIX family)
VPGWLAPVEALLRSPDPGVLSDWVAPAGTTARLASVLVLFGAGERGPEVLLLERSHDMRSHAGQVAFPGGAQDPGEDEIAAAVREAAEETGLDATGVHVLGALPKIWLPPSNFEVTPVLAWWRDRSDVFAVDPAETASVHVIAVADLVDPARRVMIRHTSGYTGPGFLVNDLVVWGFTAGLLSRILHRVGWSRPWDEARVVDLPATLTASSLRDMERAEFER